MSGGWHRDESPFHPGEQKVQKRLGVRDIEDWARKVVHTYLPEDHRAFHTALPFLVVAARDAQGRPWATLLTGREGFVASPDPRSLVIQAEPVRGDRLESALVRGADIGVLGIELSTRRRNRVNGRILVDSPGVVTFGVEQAFGNCPQYIREREWRRVEGEPAGPPAEGTRLTSSQRKWIDSADTFFIASGYRANGESTTFGMDVSHRGGDHGFVRVASDRRLEFPDYAGNNHFNTIGNLVLDPRAGFLFIDFGTGSLLQLTGRATVDWDSEAVARIPGARRLVTFDIEGLRRFLPIEKSSPRPRPPSRADGQRATFPAAAKGIRPRPNRFGAFAPEPVVGGRDGKPGTRPDSKDRAQSPYPIRG